MYIVGEHKHICIYNTWKKINNAAGNQKMALAVWAKFYFIVGMVLEILSRFFWFFCSFASVRQFWHLDAGTQLPGCRPFSRLYVYINTKAF